jgi:hypothetical protein
MAKKVFKTEFKEIEREKDDRMTLAPTIQTIRVPDPERQIIWTDKKGYIRLVAVWDIRVSMSPKVLLECRMATDDAMGNPRWAPAAQVPPHLEEIYEDFVASFHLPTIQVVKERVDYDRYSGKTPLGSNSTYGSGHRDLISPRILPGYNP